MADDSKAQERAETLNIQARQSMNTGGFAEAATFYSRAIELTPDNYKLYSNRALAYVRLKNYQGAVKDADKCISLNPNFVKAYSTKGAALTWLGRTSEARAAYLKGLEVDPNHAVIKANLAGLASQPTQTQPAAQAASSLSAYLSANQFYSIQSLARLFMIVNAVVYIIPFVVSPMTSYSCYRRMLMAFMAHCAISVFHDHGRPKFNMQYAAAVFRHHYCLYFFLALMFFTARPRALALFPLMALEAAHLAGFLYNVAIRGSPGLANSMAASGVKWGQAMTGNPNFHALSYQAKWGAVTNQVMQWCAMAEVILGISLIVEVFTPMRNILLVFMYWQLMQIRYMASTHVQAAFRSVDQRIQGFTTHARMPRVVHSFYMTIRGWLAARVTPPPPGQQPQSRCSIM